MTDETVQTVVIEPNQRFVAGHFFPFMETREVLYNERIKQSIDRGEANLVDEREYDNLEPVYPDDYTQWWGDDRDIAQVYDPEENAVIIDSAVGPIAKFPIDGNVELEGLSAERLELGGSTTVRGVSPSALDDDGVLVGRRQFEQLVADSADIGPVSNIGETVDNLDTTAQTLEHDLGNLEGEVETLDDALDALEIDVSDLEDDVSVIEGDVDSLEDEVESIDETVDEQLEPLEDKTSGLSEDGTEYEGESVSVEETETDILTGGFLSEDEPAEGLWLDPSDAVVGDYVDAGHDRFNTFQEVLDYANDVGVKKINVSDWEGNISDIMAPYEGQTIYGDGRDVTHIDVEGRFFSSDNNPDNITIRDLTLSCVDGSANAVCAIFEGMNLIRVGIETMDEHEYAMRNFSGENARIIDVIVSGPTTGVLFENGNHAMRGCYIPGNIHSFGNQNIVKGNWVGEETPDDTDHYDNVIIE